MRCSRVEDLSLAPLTGTGGGGEGPFVLGRKGGGSVQGGVGVRNEEEARTPVFADLSLLILVLLPFTSSSLLCLQTPIPTFSSSHMPMESF